MIDEILIPELKNIFEELSEIEGKLSSEEKLNKHKGLKDLSVQIIELSDVTRKEGLLALEGELDSRDKLTDMIKDMVLLMLETSDIPRIERISLMRELIIILMKL